MNALMNEGDTLLNLDDFFQEEMVEEDVQDPEEIVEVEPAEEMEVSGEDEAEEGVNVVDEGGDGEQEWGDVNLEDIQMYHVSDSEDSDSEDSDYESDSDFYDSTDSEVYGFRTHELNSDGVCTRCSVEMPQNQLCN